ncbi:hypothetical protein IX307_001662 [Bacteroides pyogenes]|uniref:DUF4857 domain-containing protein n=1 Tax=Bacteroides pyogenes TaxID=310300 RepID=UPI001BA54EA4|nr:DUF4857 domain-containing protein [Bacteroides pyogenes]MBR8720495.1 hypothetical protein [Bacteroides pyogenes]MBR8724304.1 hypothetical protein [Bacteroides pyogenes]MBR8737487.1 hypothetical protein [Bacteroides pyogenes]MBR8753530.1 hypothetical protein [Bacteroides pyogenes]MBR8787337.1 hypothetical protein [Bacteroides pyogenes]
MKHFSTLLLFLTVCFLLLWQLPWCYNFFAAKPGKTPFTLYSTVIGDFAMIGHEEEKGMIRRDLAGGVYTQAQFDSILPMFYLRQLVADDRFPDSIHGVAVTPKEVQMENITFRSVPSEVNAPVIGLYPLLESLSGRVDLKMPDDIFRITGKGIEFIDMASNSVNVSKSLRFTEAMKKKGFHFPARAIAGNPTVKKEYDEGYLVLDADSRLFHLKQVKGRPFVRAVNLPEGVELKHLYVTEFRNKKVLGLLSGADHSLYVLNNRTYEVVKVGVSSFNPESDELTLLGNMFDWTIRISTPREDCYYAVDANDYTLIKSFVRSRSRNSIPGLTFTSYKDKWVYPRFE